MDGEVAVRGASVTSGYLDNPEANQAAFREGWFHTGDMGRLDSDGFLFLTGRLKEMIDRGGEKVNPEEVEGALEAHPAVAEAAVFAISHRTLGEDVAAAVVLREGAVASEVEMRRFAAVRLARFKVPRRIVFLERDSAHGNRKAAAGATGGAVSKRHSMARAAAGRHGYRRTAMTLGRSAIGALLAIAVPAAIWFAPLGADATARHALAVAAFMIVAWIASGLPHALTGMRGATCSGRWAWSRSAWPSAALRIRRRGSCSGPS